MTLRTFHSVSSLCVVLYATGRSEGQPCGARGLKPFVSAYGVPPGIEETV